jgi:hypothetical protein
LELRKRNKWIRAVTLLTSPAGGVACGVDTTVSLSTARSLLGWHHALESARSQAMYASGGCACCDDHRRRAAAAAAALLGARCCTRAGLRLSIFFQEFGLDWCTRKGVYLFLFIGVVYVYEYCTACIR